MLVKALKTMVRGSARGRSRQMFRLGDKFECTQEEGEEFIAAGLVEEIKSAPKRIPRKKAVKKVVAKPQETTEE